MPFAIKHKGQVIEATPYVAPVVEEDEEQRESRLSHAGYMVWDNYMMMCEARKVAVLAWEEKEILGEEMDARGVNHPAYGRAMNKLGDYEGIIVANQVRYLAAERRADTAWKQLSKEERAEQLLNLLFMVEPNARHLLGLWHQPFNSSLTPEPEFRMLKVSLMAAPSAQVQVYLNQRFGKDDRHADD